MCPTPGVPTPSRGDAAHLGGSRYLLGNGSRLPPPPAPQAARERQAERTALGATARAVPPRRRGQRATLPTTAERNAELGHATAPAPRPARRKQLRHASSHRPPRAGRGAAAGTERGDVGRPCGSWGGARRSKVRAQALEVAPAPARELRAGRRRAVRHARGGPGEVPARLASARPGAGRWDRSCVAVSVGTGSWCRSPGGAGSGVNEVPYPAWLFSSVGCGCCGPLRIWHKHCFS